ncbi:sporulation initiation phosphotransferase B [Bacillus benzoevorans]|uniref:Stage 0 sporulation protein B (Sporulation initiation phosphotransferase) n=1 Tax=Bacillus benzoevorans TaxID=1456 RepID=A0A7X0LVU5_9BACI|nr:sporulation initiation phosphotransferase B [Bacillus benzoevorans]MBB6445885.1 stage 0 sporulation protein B (sporulation initiation phosphotransferase) [Bacillus benzoevorans]
MIKKDWDTVAMLRHVRHDWLNKLQLIKGNIDLNKIDHARRIIEEIVIETQNETKLSNLGIPQFTAMLLTHNWKSQAFQLEFEVVNDLKCGGLDDKALSKWMEMFFACLNEAVQQYADNHLMISIEPQPEGIRFFFDFSGIIVNNVQIEAYLANASFGQIERQLEITERDFTFECFVTKMKE